MDTGALRKKVLQQVGEILHEQYELVAKYRAEQKGKSPDYKRLRAMRRRWEELEFLRIMVDDDYQARYKLLAGTTMPEFLKDQQGDTETEVPDNVLSEKLYRYTHDVKKRFAGVRAHNGRIRKADPEAKERVEEAISGLSITLTKDGADAPSGKE